MHDLASRSGLRGSRPLRDSTESRSVCTGGPLKTRVGLSGGGACGACGSDIFVGDIEYRVVVEGREMNLDASCYLILVEEAAQLQRDA